MKRVLQVLLLWVTLVGLAFAAVDINTAGEAELDKLPGIGPAKAKAIVEDRKTNGPFKSIEDLKRVKGIGDKTFDELRNQISVTGGATTPVAPKAPPAPTAKPPSAPAPAATEGKATPAPAPAAERPAAIKAAAPAGAGALPGPAGAKAALETKPAAPPAPAGAKPAGAASIAAKPVDAKADTKTDGKAAAMSDAKPEQAKKSHAKDHGQGKDSKMGATDEAKPAEKK